MQGGNLRFSNLHGIHDLAKALVESNLVQTYTLVYLLVNSTLITCCYDNCGESILIHEAHKNKMQNNISDQCLIDCLLCYIECDLFANVSNDVIIDHF